MDKLEKALRERMSKANSRYGAKEYNAYMDGILDLVYALQESHPELTYVLHTSLNNAEEFVETQEN